MGDDVFTTISAISDGFGTALSFLPSELGTILIAAVGFVILFSVVGSVVKMFGEFF